MLLHFIRAIFIIVIAAALFVSITSDIQEMENAQTITEYQHDIRIVFIGGISLAVLVLFIDWLLPKQSLSSLAGIFFGLLVGIFFSWALSLVLDMVNMVFKLGLDENSLQLTKWIMGICVCYLVISFIMRTKDDVRFIIPYVKFARQSKGVRPLVLDTSVIIDGRIADLCNSKIFDSPFIVPRFILNELQLIADSADKLKRTRGRRGLDILGKMQHNSLIDISVDDTPPPEVENNALVDHKLVAFTKNCNGKLVTNDYNLSKVANVRGVDVININDVANSLKSVVLPGEHLAIKVIKAGEEQEQGIGYLEDGTMVVVEDGRGYIGSRIQISVTSALQTSAGRMIFGRYEKTINNKNGSSNRKSEPAKSKK